MELKFKEYFDTMRDSLKDNFVFRGNLLLVELEGEEEVTETKGGLLIASSKEQVHGLNSGRAKIGYVHLAGSGYIDGRWRDNRGSY